MKKRIAIILLAAMMLMLAACGSKATTVPAPQTEAEDTQASKVEAQTEAQEIQTASIDAQAVYQSLEGFYQDSVGQRASLYAWQTDDGLGIRVSWASSAFQENEWDMIAVLMEDNKLEYTNCVQYEMIYRENGEYDTKEIASKQKGYFTIADGKLLWNGAADETCKACVFERMPEEAQPQSWEPEYAGVYRRSWSEEIGGKEIEMNSYIVLNEDHTGYWIAQAVGTLTWDESRIMETIGETCDIALTEENGTVNLLVYRFQDENGVWIPTVFEKIEALPAEMEAMIAEAETI